ncbi:M23 family metallopeptidase [bacterium]|nr:M23 family metallopeptidase [bacterium]
MKILFIFLTLFSTLFAQYKWVLPSSHMMTSSFAEFRVGHFHAGIDLHAPVGMPIVAPADGWVQRVSISPWGYGKALYFVFDDSLTAVFGHLSRYAKKVQNRVVSEQYKKKSSIVNLYFKKNENSFKAGDVIAYTGKTGVGLPHLHFETRRGLKTLVSPFHYGFTSPDTFAPTIVRIAVVPLSQDAWVEESLLPLIIKSGDDYYSRKKPVRFWGKIGFALDFFDKTSSENSNRLGVRFLELFLDGEKIFSCDYDSFKISETRNIGFLYDGGLEYLYHSRFHRLFVKDSLKITQFAGNKPNAGILDGSILTSRIHSLRIRLEDFTGNVTEETLSIIPSPVEDVSLQFIYNDSGEAMVTVLGDTDDLAIQFCKKGENKFHTIAQNKKSIPLNNRNGFFRPIGLGSRQIYSFILGTMEEQKYRSEQCSLFVMEDFLYYLDKLDIPPVCVPEFAISGISIEYQMLTPTKWLLRHNSAELEQNILPAVEVFLGDPEFPYAKLGEFSPVLCLMGFWTESKESSKLWKTALRIPGDALYSSTAIYNWFEPVRGENIASSLFHYLPDWLYFKEPASIVFEPTAKNSLPDDSLKKLCIVRWWNNNWYYVPSKLKGRQIIAKVRALGSFALQWDFEPPIAKLLSADADTIVLSVNDNLSGFGAGNLPTAYIDSVWTLAEYDPEGKTITILPHNPLDKGKHSLKILAIDRAENKFENDWEIKIP